MTDSLGGSFLLELLHYAGWRLEVRKGAPARVRATRNGLEIDITAANLPQAAGTVFARAMRSGHRTDKASSLSDGR